MPTLHKTPFEVRLQEVIQANPSQSLSCCVTQALRLVASRVEGLPAEQTPEIDAAAHPCPQDSHCLMVAVTQSLVLRDMFCGFLPTVLRRFTDPHTFGTNAAALESGQGSPALGRPAIRVWAELDEDALRMYWEQVGEPGGSLVQPAVDIDPESCPNLVLTLEKAHWSPALAPLATPSQQQLATLVPLTLLNCLHNLLQCLDAVCDVWVSQWPVAADGQLRITSEEDRFMLLLVEETANARRALRVVTVAANNALAAQGLRDVGQYQQLQRECRRASSLGAAIRRASGKPSSAAQAQRLARYVRHVEDVTRLVRAFYAAARKLGVPKNELDGFISALA